MYFHLSQLLFIYYNYFLEYATDQSECQARANSSASTSAGANSTREGHSREPNNHGIISARNHPLPCVHGGE